MARFEPKGVDGMSLDLQKLGQISDQDAYTILTPAADLLAEKFKDKLSLLFSKISGKLVASIRAMRKQSGGVFYMLVYPYGDHHKYNARVRSYTVQKRADWGVEKRKTKGGVKMASANDVAFVLEYGSPARGIEASHWMEKTIQENEEQILEAMQRGFDELCDERGIGREE